MDVADVHEYNLCGREPLGVSSPRLPRNSHHAGIFRISLPPSEGVSIVIVDKNWIIVSDLSEVFGANSCQTLAYYNYMLGNAFRHSRIQRLS